MSYHTLRRKHFKKTGLCGRCGKRKPLKNKISCSVCLKQSRDQHRRFYNFKKKQGLCVICGAKSVDGRVECQNCLDRESERNLIIRNLRKKRGLCPCGKCKPIKNKVYCSKCILQRRLGVLRRSGLSKLELERAIHATKHFLGKCECCGRRNQEWCFDHNHKSKKFRGIICHSCNLALGLVNDNPKILLEYVKKFDG